MKKMIALVMACLLMLGSCCFAAEWKEGLGPQKPYSNAKEVDLTTSMGYVILYPRDKKHASIFCDVLEIYLPREDLALGEGSAHLYAMIDGKGTEIDTIDFTQEGRVSLRKLADSELDALMWGGGMAIEMYLSRSLEMGDGAPEYYVLMDAGCFTAAEGTVSSLPIQHPEGWVPVLDGEYGISGLFYAEAEPEAEAAEEPEEELAEESEEEAEEEPEEEPAPVIVTNPDTGDSITFDVVLGGEAAIAVIYSENDSVSFAGQEFTENTTVTGRVTKDELQWGVVFLREDGSVVQAIDLKK